MVTFPTSINLITCLLSVKECRLKNVWPKIIYTCVIGLNPALNRIKLAQATLLTFVELESCSLLFYFAPLSCFLLVSQKSLPSVLLVMSV